MGYQQHQAAAKHFRQQVYGKIEEKSRKTDPFLAGVASMVIEDVLGDGMSVFEDLPVIIG